MIIGKNMVKSIGAVGLTMALILSAGTFAFATENTANSIQAEERADIAERFVD